MKSEELQNKETIVSTLIGEFFPENIGVGRFHISYALGISALRPKDYTDDPRIVIRAKDLGWSFHDLDED